MGKRVFPQDSSINSVSSTPSLHIRACSLPVDNTIKNDYLPYGNYSSRCVVHMDSTFASHVSIQAAEVFRIAACMETSLWLDLPCVFRGATMTTKYLLNASGLGKGQREKSILES